MTTTIEQPGSGSAAVSPKGNLSGFVRFFRQDVVSGLLVFLIALPLCLGISIASGFPPIAGIFTAIIGALLTPLISDSELTIKGPAAGLIVIVFGCVNAFGGPENPDAYRSALAVGAAAAVLQILFGLLRAGILGEFFPTSAVHGMLAAIGVIIMIKQIPVALGVSASGEPLQMLRQIPEYVAEANPAIASIGIVSIALMFLWPWLGTRFAALKRIPAPLVVLLAAVPMGYAFDLLHQHSYTLQGHQYQLGEQYLVRMPDRMFGMFDFVTFPMFEALRQPVAWKWVLMFFLIGSLESMLSAKAVDLLDPWKRKTSMNRDLAAVGTANLAASLVGGLPMISEIVRSRANIDNGARTRFADLWHGVFLLLCVGLIPAVLHRIPLAALAGMLVYTGFRLAHPREFLNVYRIGREQLLIFITTIIMVLATDLLIGVAAGIVLKLVIHLLNGVPLRSLFKTYLEVEPVDDNTSLIVARESAVFSNWIPFKRQIEELGYVQHQNVIVDFSDTRLVDHSVMEKLEQMERDFAQEGLQFEVRGLDALQPLSENSHAARKRGLAPMQRLTVVASESIERWLEDRFIELGATGFTSIPCSGAGQKDLEEGSGGRHSSVRIEVVVPDDTCNDAVSFLRDEVMPHHAITACVESVRVIRRNHFARPLAVRPPSDCTV